VETSASLAAGIVESLQYLTGYPYGCVEQTMSRFLPDVLVQQALDRLGLSNQKLRADLPKQVEDGLMRLYGMQRNDGGWGWWEGDQSDARISAYVVYGLIEAKRAGFAVDGNVLRSGALYLRDPLFKTADTNLKAYLVYVLSEYGEGDISLARSLLDRKADLTLESRAYLAQTLKLVNSPAEAKALSEELAAQAIQTASYAHWEERNQLDRYMTSDGRTSAVVLQTLVRIDVDNPVVVKAVRWLMDSRKGGFWRTTQETAATVIALTDYLAHTSELDSSYSYALSVNGRQVKDKQVAQATLAERESTTVNDPVTGVNEIKLSKQGQGTLYFSAAMEYYLQRESIGAATAGGGPTVMRTYADPGSGRPLTKITVGDLVQVVLTLTVPGDMWYVIIEDPLPAGLEAVNQTLRTSSIKDGKATSYWMHPEYRDEKTAFFAYSLWKGVHTYSYMARATTVGTFRVLPVTVYPMYMPETWGRSSSAVMDISNQR
jgi:alpha-2-macroglobulin